MNYTQFNIASSLALYRLKNEPKLVSAVNAAIVNLLESAPPEWQPDTLSFGKNTITLYSGLHPADTARTAPL